MIALVAGILRAIANGLEREGTPATAGPVVHIQVEHMHVVDADHALKSAVSAEYPVDMKAEAEQAKRTWKWGRP